jgi:hypothetical protein
MLASSGALSETRPHASPAAQLRVMELRDTAADAKRLLQAARESTHRSIYLPLLRTLTPASLEVFDFAEQSLVTGSRDTTTVPTQSLYLLNDSFVRQRSRGLTKELLDDEADMPKMIDRVYYRILGRAAASHEFSRALSFIEQYESALLSEPKLKQVAADASVKSGIRIATTTNSKPVVEQNPDNVSRSQEVAEVLEPDSPDPRVAAWAAFCQALYASAEFRYLK